MNSSIFPAAIKEQNCFIWFDGFCKNQWQV